MKITRWYRWLVIAAVVMVIAVALRLCGFGQEIETQSPGEEIDATLTLQTVTLEQPDEDGQLLWKLKADSVNYSPDSQRAELKNLEGEFFQDGEVTYIVEADEGEVRQNGEVLYLMGNLVAASPERELVLESERLKWLPKQDRLVMGEFEEGQFEAGEFEAIDAPVVLHDSGVENLAETAFPIESAVEQPVEASLASFEAPPVKGFNEQVEAVAKIMTVLSADNRVELSGGVIAKSKAEPWMTFTSQSLVWLTEQAEIEANQPLKVEQYEEKTYQTLTDRVSGNEGRVDLAENVVTLQDAVRLDALTQPLRVESELAVWDVDAQQVVMDSPVQIIQPQQRVNASADKANVDLGKEIIYLTGNVRAIGEEKDSRLTADQVRWQTGSQDVEATGNVTYVQARDPDVSLVGTRAVGNLDRGTVVVTGGEGGSERGGQVSIEIVPDE
ncbi:MAG: LPS export ABC transporter periplasmic protein LptC [Cyanobacteria bacterium P01_D01_bin.105]